MPYSLLITVFCGYISNDLFIACTIKLCLTWNTLSSKLHYPLERVVSGYILSKLLSSCIRPSFCSLIYAIFLYFTGKCLLSFKCFKMNFQFRNIFMQCTRDQHGSVIHNNEIFWSCIFLLILTFSSIPLAWIAWQ